MASVLRVSFIWGCSWEPMGGASRLGMESIRFGGYSRSLSLCNPPLASVFQSSRHCKCSRSRSLNYITSPRAQGTDGTDAALSTPATYVPVLRGTASSQATTLYRGSFQAGAQQKSDNNVVVLGNVP
eukprot:jgi/Botrbrau1/22557/Bobra.0740s0001.1